jgi:hypothetical protein
MAAEDVIAARGLPTGAAPLVYGQPDPTTWQRLTGQPVYGSAYYNQLANYQSQHPDPYAALRANRNVGPSGIGAQLASLFSATPAQGTLGDALMALGPADVPGDIGAAAGEIGRLGADALRGLGGEEGAIHLGETIGRGAEGLGRLGERAAETLSRMFGHWPRGAGAADAAAAREVEGIPGRIEALGTDVGEEAGKVGEEAAKEGSRLGKAAKRLAVGRKPLSKKGVAALGLRAALLGGGITTAILGRVPGLGSTADVTSQQEQDVFSALGSYAQAMGIPQSAVEQLITRYNLDKNFPQLPGQPKYDKNKGLQNLENAVKSLASSTTGGSAALGPYSPETITSLQAQVGSVMGPIAQQIQQAGQSQAQVLSQLAKNPAVAQFPGMSGILNAESQMAVPNANEMAAAYQAAPVAEDVLANYRQKMLQQALGSLTGAGTSSLGSFTSAFGGLTGSSPLP